MDELDPPTGIQTGPSGASGCSTWDQLLGSRDCAGMQGTELDQTVTGCQLEILSNSLTRVLEFFIFHWACPVKQGLRERRNGNISQSQGRTSPYSTTSTILTLLDDSAP